MSMAFKMTPQNGVPLIAAGVSRVSLEKQVDNYSLAAQDRKFNELGEMFGFTVPPGLLIEDEGYSGADFNRPSIRRVLDLAHEGKIQAVAFTHLDRFARDLEGGLALLRTYRGAGLKVLLGKLGWYDGNERQLKIQVQLGLMFAEMQKDDIKEKSRGGIDEKIAEGKAHGGMAPYGYRFVGALELTAEAMAAKRDVPTGKPANRFDRVEAELDTVRTMYELAESGISLRAVGRQLMALGLKPRKAAKWSAATIKNILTNEIYGTGEWHYNKRSVVTEGVVPRKNRRGKKVPMSQKLKPREQWAPAIKLPGEPVVTKERFERMRDMVTTRGQLFAGRPTRPERRSMLRRMMTCGACGFAMRTDHSPTTGGRMNRYYLCGKRDKLTGQHLCPAGYKSHRALELDSFVWDTVSDAFCGNLDSLLRQHERELRSGVDSGNLDRLRTQEDRLTRKMLDAAERELNEQDKKLRTFYREQVADAKAQLAVIRPQIAALSKVGKFTVDASVLTEQAMRGIRAQTDPEKRREVLLDIVGGIVVEEHSIEITLRVPVAQSGSNTKQTTTNNCKQLQHTINSCLLIPIRVKLPRAA